VACSRVNFTFYQ